LYPLDIITGHIVEIFFLIFWLIFHCIYVCRPFQLESSWTAARQARDRDDTPSEFY